VVVVAGVVVVVVVVVVMVAVVVAAVAAAAVVVVVVVVVAAAAAVVDFGEGGARNVWKSRVGGGEATNQSQQSFRLGVLGRKQWKEQVL
jgi:hypothetical protein